MGICVGEYVRTKRGEICKVIGVRQEQRAGKRVYSHLAYYLDNHKGSLTPAFIVKHSPNIIDLIEEGDFVNNRQVLRVFIDPFTKKKRLLIGGTEINWQGDMSAIYCEAENIKSIITKEQIESIKYEV